MRPRTLATRFATFFKREYDAHRWPRAKSQNYTNRTWTEEMTKIIGRSSRRLGLVERRDELKRVDFTYYRRSDPVPTVVIEHDNGWNVFEEEIPKLLASSAQLKVLICYPPKRSHYPFGNRLFNLLNAVGRTAATTEEFLLIMGLPNMLVHESQDYTVYWYHPVYKVERIR